MKKNKIDVKHLRLGMYIEELDRPWTDTPFLFQGFYLRTQEDIQEVQKQCQYVYISEGDSPAADRTAAVPAPTNHIHPPVSPSQPRVFFEQEIAEAQELRLKAKELIDNIHEDIRKRRNIDIEGSQQIVDSITQSILHNPNALLWLTYLKSRDEYTALHSMNVCVLATLFGHHLGIDEASLRELGLSALLHDMGKLRVPMEILNKPEELTEQELAIMKKHPAYGVELLQSPRRVSSAVLEVVHSHHERVNGEGYPRGLGPDKISEFTKLVSIIDVYDAMTSDRVYRDGAPPPEVILFMYRLRGQHFDTHLMEQFVQCMGLFPIGSLVEIETGEVGVVISQNKGNPLKPKLMLVLDEDKNKYYRLRMLNLRLFEKTSSKFRIKQGLPCGAYDINVGDYVKEVTAT